MKKLFLIAILLIVPILLLGCTAGSAQTADVEAAESVPVERPSQVTELPDTPPKYCPVTQPPEARFIPPDPFKEYPYPGQFWYGDEGLWTALPIDHTWSQLPYNPERGYGQKVFFQREGYNWKEEPQPALTVSGRRIDPENSEGVTLTASDATNGYTPEDKSFMLVGVEIPTAGCWEITGRYGDAELTFVIWVAP